jgi:hypothetical protein
MNNTMAFAQIWGPILTAIGFGIFISKSYYVRLYRDLEKNSLAVFGLGIAFMLLGTIQSVIHTAWGTFPQIVITLLGWGVLLKGILFLVAPGIVNKAGKWEAKKGFVPFVGVVVLILGLYLLSVGYWM